MRGDVSIVRLHRISLDGITHSATKGHTLILIKPWTEHDFYEACFRRNNTTVNIPARGVRAVRASGRARLRRLLFRSPGSGLAPRHLLRLQRSISIPRRYAPRATTQAREKGNPPPRSDPCSHCASREPLVFRGQVFFLCPSRANRIIKPPADDPLCARRRFRFRAKAKFFSRGPILAKCKIFLRAGGTCERGSRRGTGGAIRSI